MALRCLIAGADINGVLLSSGHAFKWASVAEGGGDIYSSADTFLERGAAGVIDANASAAAGGDGVLRSKGLRIRDDGTVTYGTGSDVEVQGETTTLTDGVATTVFSVVTGDGDMAGLKIDYTIQATDATEYQSESGTVHIAIVDDAGGVVASTPGEVSVQALSSGTLTSTWSVVTTDDQSIEIQVTADSSLTTSTFQIRWVATYSGDVSLTVP